MDEFTNVTDVFHASIDRARQLIGLHEILVNNYTEALNSDDCLRAAVVQTISSFDHLMHESFCAAVSKRLRENRDILGLEIPFSCLHLPDVERVPSIELFVRKSISHKTYVDPEKMVEALKHFDQHPWNQLSAFLSLDVQTIKLKQKQLYRWRNRIAHEADINPANAGVDLFPIDKTDVHDAITFFSKLGD
ncbi:MAG: hypothetical protein ACI8Z1_003461, partial [Candidatus Azotimanducaceae bacterium]